MKITSATVVMGFGTDKIILDTDLPNPIWPYNNNLHFTAECAHGSGEAYCKKHFGLSPDMVKRI